MPILQNLLRGVGQAAGVAGQVVQGYGHDQANNTARVLAEAKLAEEKRRNAVLDRVSLAGIDPTNRGAIAGAEAAARVPAAVAQATQLVPVKVDEAVKTAAAVAPTQEAVHTANRKTDVANPLPTPAPHLVFPTIGGTATEPGKVVGVDPTTGKVVTEVGDAKAPTAGAGSAKMMQGIASNDATIANIDKAIAAARANPDAFGTENLRGLPMVGGFLDQRMDPNGVGPRAMVANVGSQKMHDRYGGALTVGEAERAKPFIPGTGDTADKIVSNLEEMKKVIMEENAAMKQAGAPRGHVVPHGTVSDADFARAWQAGKRTDADIAAWVAANPKRP